MGEPLRIRGHRIRREGDVAVAQIVGTFNREDAVPFHEFLAAILAAEGRCYLLADVSAMVKLDTDARRYAAAWNARHRLAGIAVCRAGGAVRAVTMLLVNTLRMIRRKDAVPLEFLADEAEGRRWIAGLKAAARASGG
ncbi:MAG: hypothetical protein JNL82_04845 [Myxococcales bacterium]|nr:hypothetical protein [Myxococcales bacterium]